MNITQLFEPLIAAILSLLVQIGSRLSPEIISDVKSLLSTAIQILVAYGTLQLSKDEASDSFSILVDTLKMQGETLLGKLEIEGEKVPSEILGILSSTLGSIPGELLKLI